MKLSEIRKVPFARAHSSSLSTPGKSRTVIGPGDESAAQQRSTFDIRREASELLGYKYVEAKQNKDSPLYNVLASLGLYRLLELDVFLYQVDEAARVEKDWARNRSMLNDTMQLMTWHRPNMNWIILNFSDCQRSGIPDDVLELAIRITKAMSDPVYFGIEYHERASSAFLLVADKEVPGYYAEELYYIASWEVHENY